VSLSLNRTVHRYLDYIYQDTVALRWQAEMQALQNIKTNVYLDCGCHIGRKTLNAAQRLSPKVIVGLEYGTTYLLEAKQRGIRVLQSDLNAAIPLDSGCVDVATAFDVLEHLVETWGFVQELYRVLAPGGYLILDSPNLASWHNVFALVLGIQPFSGPNLISMAESDLKLIRSMRREGYGFADNGEVTLAASDVKRYRHIVVATYRSLINVLKQAGFTIEGAWGFGYYPFPPVLARILCKLDPAHAHHYVIKARKPGPSHDGGGQSDSLPT
jgi:SAM-dependent methyltransferase